MNMNINDEEMRANPILKGKAAEKFLKNIKNSKLTKKQEKFIDECKRIVNMTNRARNVYSIDIVKDALKTVNRLKVLLKLNSNKEVINMAVGMLNYFTERRLKGDNVIVEDPRGNQWKVTFNEP